MNRRTFLRSALASGLFVATPEPVRHFWQVGIGKPLRTYDGIVSVTIGGREYGVVGSGNLVFGSRAQSLTSAADAARLYGEGSMPHAFMRWQESLTEHGRLSRRVTAALTLTLD